MVGSFTRESPYRIYKRSWLAWLSYMKIKYSEQGLRVVRNKIRNFVVLSTHGSFIILPSRASHMDLPTGPTGIPCQGPTQVERGSWEQGGNTHMTNTWPHPGYQKTHRAVDYNRHERKLVKDYGQGNRMVTSSKLVSGLAIFAGGKILFIWCSLVFLCRVVHVSSRRRSK